MSIIVDTSSLLQAIEEISQEGKITLQREVVEVIMILYLKKKYPNLILPLAELLVDLVVPDP